MKEKTLSVSAIQTGTVIDHITAGRAWPIVRILRLNEDGRQVTIGLNLKSRSHGLKDLIKLESASLSPEQIACIAVFSPHATVNLIEQFKVVAKIPVSLPEMIRDLLHCPNPQCITRHERAKTRFAIQGANASIQLRCHHCEKPFSRDDFSA